MDGYSISEVAERTGFPPTTLRFYEQAGLVAPERTPAGYRSYDDRHIELLAFIGRAKGFGLSLEEITELLGLLDEDRCAPVQDRLRDLVDTKIADAQDKAVELQAFTAELRRVAVTLASHTPDGPCDDACGCTTEQPAGEAHAVELTMKPDPSGEPVIACTLAPDRVGDRLAEWHSVLTRAVDHQPVVGGTRIEFGRGIDIAGLATLVAAEQDCCPFFTFTLRIGPDQVTLDVTGPPDARPVIDALIGRAL